MRLLFIIAGIFWLGVGLRRLDSPAAFIIAGVLALVVAGCVAVANAGGPGR